jgi:hypothetical protein
MINFLNADIAINSSTIATRFSAWIRISNTPIFPRGFSPESLGVKSPSSFGGNPFTLT